MPDHDVPVGAEMKVQFEGGNAEIQGGLERRQRVLRFQSSRATVALDVEAGREGC